MTSNFDFIPSPWKLLSQTLKEAEQQVYPASSYAAVLCRKSLEEWVRWLYENDADLELPYDTTLNALLYEQDFKDLLAPSLFKQVNLVRKLGNDAVHTNLKVKPAEVLHALELLHGFTAWVVRIYSDDKPQVPRFNTALVPTESEVVRTKRDLEKLEQAFLQTRELNKQLQEELERLKANKEAHAQAVPPPADPNEAVTRKLYINLLLKEAGWNPDGANVCEYPVTGMPTGDGRNNGPGKADYVLWGSDGKPLAVVEAKRTSKDAKAGQHQAKLYADCLEQMHGQRPVIFYTNGFETWIWDDTEYAPRKVFGFYAWDELQLLIQRRTTRTSLADAVVNADIADRYYQIEAIRSVGKVLEGRGREALLVMATGTGKTRTAAAMVDMFSKCNWVKRVLFLADRNELIYQAQKAFTNHLPNLPNVDLTREKNKEQARVVFSTYQTMINLIDQYEDNKRYFGTGHFDMVIFDEIHRSVYNKYKAIFEYFDAFRIGLTATPRSEGDRDTYQLFGMKPQDPTFAYELEQAVDDRFLVPPKAISVPLKFHRQGIRYSELSKEEQLEYEAMLANPVTGEFPDEVNSAAINSWLFNIDTVDKALAHLMKNGIKVAGGDRLGKTIIFARNHKHAIFIEQRFNKQYPRYKGDFCKVIDNYEPYAYDLLTSFKLKEKGPHIAISVDMLDTGIDVPEVVNLVFFKPVKSRAKFWQMIGRGTRLCKNLFAPGDDKKEFIIFDYCENFEFFGNKPKGVENTQGRTLTQQLFQQRLKLIRILQDNPDGNIRQFAEEVQQGLVKQVQSLNDESFLVRQHWRIVEKYKDPAKWHALNDLDVKEVLDHLSALVVEKGDDELAKRFDLFCLNMQTGLAAEGQVPAYLMNNVLELTAQLLKKTTIPAVAAQKQFLEEVQKTAYWPAINTAGIEDLRKRVRDIVKFIEKSTGRVIYTNFEDEIGEETVTSDILGSGSYGLGAYKKRVEHFIRSQQHHITINKLRLNYPITSGEVDTLEKMLFSQGEIGTREDFVKTYGPQPLGQFIRRIVGLDVNAAKEAFAGFINQPALNPTQIRFINTIINYLTINGTIDKAALFEKPFTDIASNGLIDVFSQEQAAQIVSLVEIINKNAVAG